MPVQIPTQLLAAALAIPLATAGAGAFATEPAAPAPAAASPVEPATQAAGDTAGKTARGATFVVPEGWSQRPGTDAVLLAPPEADGSRIAIVDAAGTDPDAAVAAAWAVLGATPKLLVATDAAARDGWDARRFYRYDVAENARRQVHGAAFRKGDTWTVLVADFDNAIAEKRSSQVVKVLQRLLPPGHQRESFAGRSAHAFDAARLKQLTDFVAQMRQDYEVPGVAIGLVQDGKVLLSQGFGERRLGDPVKVDGDTRFMIASNTKPLTTLMLAKLVDAGRLDWNAPVTSVYPRFRLGDTATTGQVLVKHLICACTGMPRQDYEWLFEGESQTPATVMDTLATMQPTSGFGELFQYSNPMAAAAGYIGGQVAYPGTELGEGYDRAMQALVFDPLGMDDTTFDYAKAQTGNYASPHGFDIDRNVQVMGMGLNNTIVASRPAGAAWSTVNDLLKYVQMELDRGRLADGRPYIGEAALLQRREPQVAEGPDIDYAMALTIDNRDGVTVIDHGGDMGGFHSNMMWWPEQKVGAVILTNSDEGVMLRGPFRRRIMELMFDGDAIAQPTAAANDRANREAFAAMRKLVEVPADSAALSGLADRYRNDALGELVVERRDGRAWFDFGAFRSEVATMPQPDGSLAFVTVDPIAPGFPFVRADAEGMRRLVVRDGQHEYVFDEVR